MTTWHSDLELKAMPFWWRVIMGFQLRLFHVRLR